MNFHHHRRRLYSPEVELEEPLEAFVVVFQVAAVRLAQIEMWDQRAVSLAAE